MVVGVCKFGNALSNSTKFEEFLDKLKNLSGSQEGYFAMELVSFSNNLFILSDIKISRPVRKLRKALYIHHSN